MAFSNTIALAKNYVPLLDEVFKNAATSSVLERPERVGDFINANTVNYYKTSMDGLGNYSRNAGFVDGDVVGEWEALTLSQDRGRGFQIDSMDNEETINQAFGTLASEFIRTKVVPEIDAYRYANISQTANILTTSGAALTSSTVVAAVDAAITALDNAEVPFEGRLFFMTPNIYQAIKSSDAVTRIVPAGEGIDRRFEYFDGMPIIRVPQGRFYTKVDLNDGTTSGQTSGGYAKASAGKNINFLMLHPSALLAVKKHALPRIFTPDVNQAADAWKFQYRIYHDLWVLDNKTEGVYLHKSTT